MVDYIVPRNNRGSSAKIPVSISVDAYTLHVIDLIAERRQVKRNVVLRSAITEYAEEHDPIKLPHSIPTARQYKMRVVKYIGDNKKSN